MLERRSTACVPANSALGSTVFRPIRRAASKLIVNDPLYAFSGRKYVKLMKRTASGPPTRPCTALTGELSVGARVVRSAETAKKGVYRFLTGRMAAIGVREYAHRKR